MQQTKNLSLFGILILICTLVSVQLEAQELLPHYQILRSSIQEDANIPPFTSHSFNIVESNQFYEPYYPPFQFSSINFDEDAPLNIPLSNLTKSFGGFSEIFLKEKGILENAYLQYKEGKYGNAEAKLLSILPSNTDVGEKATLLLGWTKYHKQQQDAALSYAKAGFQAQNPTVALESFYLAWLILKNSQSWEQIVGIYKQYSISRGNSFWDTRLCLIQVLALSSLGRWNEVNNFIQHIEINRFAHSKQYHKFYEINGIAFFKRKLFKESLKNTKIAQSLNPDLSYRKKLNRFLAWQYYFLNQHSISIDLIEKALPLSLIDKSDEIKYLRLAAMIKLNRWQQVKDRFQDLPHQSIFYKYAAFLIQTQSRKSKVDPELLSTIKDIRYDFPEMTFRSALQKGNRAFRNQQYVEAEKNYLQALSADINSSDYNLSQFNLGLTHLKLGQLEKARLGFTNLLKTGFNQRIEILHYHLLFTLYGLKQKQDYLDLYKSLDLQRLSTSQAYELKFMQGNLLLAGGSYQKASEIFFHLWKQEKQIDAFESGVLAYYKGQQFDLVLELLESASVPKTEKLYALEIRSLLKTGKNKQALSRSIESNFNKDQMTELKLEVWMANQLYEKVIAYVSQLLKNSLKSPKRLLYYLSLGDAHFYLHQYTQSKNQFYKALSTTKNPLQRSSIQYNIALVAFQSEDFQSFIKETNVILAKNDLPEEIRYNLTQLLVDYYQKKNLHQKADEILAYYISHYSFQKTKAQLKRIQLHFLNRAHEKCFELAKLQNESENFYQHRDRLILFGNCGNEIGKESTIVKAITIELQEQSSEYRRNEMELILAQSYFKLGNFTKSHQLTNELSAFKLDLETKNKTRILLARNLVKLEKFDLADHELGDPNHYRKSSQYSTALELKAEIDAKKGMTDGSVKALLRIYYLPDTTEKEKLQTLVKVCEVLVHSKRILEAKKYWQRIDSEKIKNDLDTFQRYEKLGRSLQTP